MDIAQLRYFSKVYEQLNYSKASQELFMTRQALQQAVRSLERELGCTLFDARPSGLAPTSQADALYKKSRETLRSFAELEEGVANWGAEEHLPVRQGTIVNIHDIMTAKEAVNCHRRNFDQRDMHVSASSDELRGLVGRGELDVAYLYGDSAMSAGFTRVVLEEKQPLWLAVASDHPLATRPSVKAEDLRGLPFLGMGPAYDIDKTLAARCRQEGFDLIFTCTSPDTGRLLTRCAMGAGVTYWLTDAPPAAHVACVIFDEPGLFWESYAIFREGPLEENPAYRRLVGLRGPDRCRAEG